MSRRYVTLDVFADKALAGNPLAVVLDTDGLDTKAMHAIARELNLSETVFVLPPRDKKHRARLRIFTPVIEMPFAGHPTVGTAVLLAHLDHPGAEGDFLFGVEETIGVVSCAVTLRDGAAPFARFGLPRLPAEHGAPRDSGLIARALGLEIDDIGFRESSSDGLRGRIPFQLRTRPRSRYARRRAHRDRHMGRRLRAGGPRRRLRLCAPDGRPRQRVPRPHVFPGDGIPEDPATGAAVAAFAGVIARFEDLSPGEHHFRIEQGYEMGRPSLIDLAMTVEGVSLTSASIGGCAVIVGEGVLHV